jgi:predicted GNAT superfamily acetyltransferase
MVGFVHHLVAIGKRDEIIGYSHMMAVAKSVQNKGVGAKLKWAQRERALSEGRTFIKWTWDPMLARNAHFNLNRLGVVVRSYATNYYGTEYSVPTHRQIEGGEIDSDRLFAEWELDSSRVRSLASGTGLPLPEPVASIVIPPDWKTLVGVDPVRAHNEQLRVRSEFHELLAAGFICAGFRRDAIHPKYLFYKEAEMPAD